MSGYQVGQEVQGMRRGVVVDKRRRGQITVYTVDWDELGKLDHSYAELRQVLRQPGTLTKKGIQL